MADDNKEKDILEKENNVNDKEVKENKQEETKNKDEKQKNDNNDKEIRENKNETPKNTTEKEKNKKFEPVTNNNEKEKTKNNKMKKEKKVKEKNKKEKTGGKGIFTRVVAIVVILLVIIGLIYLAIPTPEKTVNNMFNSLKKGDIEQTNQYVEYNKISLAKQLEKEESTEINVDEKSLFEALEWNIKTIKTQGETATVEVEVTNKDYEIAFKNYIQEMFKKFLNNEDISDQEQFELLINEIKKEETGTKTTTQTINLVKENGRWKVTADDNLTNALYPGLEDGINSISNILVN